MDNNLRLVELVDGIETFKVPHITNVRMNQFMQIGLLKKIRIHGRFDGKSRKFSSITMQQER
jgi:hypothetical protein